MYLVPGVFLIYQLLNEESSGINIFLFAAGAVICFLAVTRFLNSAGTYEALLIRKSEFQIIQSGIFTRNVHRLEVSKIRSFSFSFKAAINRASAQRKKP